MKRDQTNTERLNALLDMIEQDGESPPGELPPAEYVAAVRDLRGPEDRRAIADAHREGRGPPDFSARRGPPGQGGPNE